MSVQSANETKLNLEDLTKKFEKLEDKTLALEILDELKKRNNMIDEQNKIIEGLNKDKTRLISENTQLFARVTVAQSAAKPDTDTNYNGVNNDLNEMIKNF